MIRQSFLKQVSSGHSPGFRILTDIDIGVLWKTFHMIHSEIEIWLSSGTVPDLYGAATKNIFPILHFDNVKLYYHILENLNLTPALTYIT
jgi:hypothetical protein